MQECLTCDGTGDDRGINPHPSPHNVEYQYLQRDSEKVRCFACKGKGYCFSCKGRGYES